MKLGSLLAKSWDLYSAHFILIAAISLIVWMPCELLQSYLEEHVFGADNVRASFKLSQFFDAFFGIIATAGILCALEQIASGGTPSIGGNLNEGLGHWGRLWFARFLMGLGFVVGLVLLVVPGVILLVRCSVLEAVVIREHVTGMDAIKRSMAITKGYFWRLVGWFTVVLIAVIFLGVFLYLPTILPALDWWLPEGMLSALMQVGTSFLTVFMWVVYDEMLKQPEESSPVPAAGQ